MNEQFINELAIALRKIGTIHAVGEEWVSYIGEIPNGGIPYCGQEVTRTTYSALWGYAQEKGLVKTEAEWQQIATDNGGNVPFYSSGDGSTTFRMPKLVGYIRGATSQSEAGEYVAEGLPNITGSIRSGISAMSGNINSSGAFGGSTTDDSTSSTIGYTSGSQKVIFANFDASRSNPIYGNSSHVTPETSVVMFGVYAFGVVTNAGELDVSAIARDVSDAKMGLNGVVRSINGLTADASGEVSVVIPPAYVLPTATSSVVGGVKVGSNITISNGKISLSKSNVTTALGYTPVKSVNGSTADASGNVAISVPTGTVSQKHNSTFNVKNSRVTKTVSGLTANKPVYWAIKCNDDNGSVGASVSSGGVVNDSVTGVTDSGFNAAMRVSGKGEVEWAVVIPSGTSITISLFGTNTASSTQLVVYQ